MTDMDVSLRLRLVNQLSRPAEEAERDLKELRKAAEQLGRTKGGSGLAEDLAKVGRQADGAKAKINEIEKGANQLRQAISRTGSGFDGFKAEANKAEQSLAQIRDKADNTRLAISRIGDGFGNFRADAAKAEVGLKGIEQQSAATKAAVGRIGDGAFEGLKGDAAAAEAAIRKIGSAADAAGAKLQGLRGPSSGMTTRGAPFRTLPLGQTSGGLATSVEGAFDQFGIPLAVGAGGAYLAGALPAGAVVGAGAAISAAAADEKRSDDLRVTGEYDAKKQAAYDRTIGIIGARYGIGTGKAQETFGALLANGIGADDAAAMTDGIVRVGKATNSDPVDVAGTSVSLSSIMGIRPEQMSSAYAGIAVGSKEGKFEMRDMAAHGPSLFAAMAGQGSKGIGGVQLTSAVIQSIARVSGSNDQAKTSFEAMLNDMVSPDVADRFKKDYKKDIYKIRADAVASGKDPVLESLRAYHAAVGGDEKKTRSLFRNSEAYKGYAAVFGDLDLIDERMKRMGKASGTIDQDFETSTDNFSSQRDRVFSNAALNIKDMAAPLLPTLTATARAIAVAMEEAREKSSADPLSNAPGTSTFKAGLEAYLRATVPDQRGVTGFQRFLYGDGAEPGFSLKGHMGISRNGTASFAERGTSDYIGGIGRANQSAENALARLFGRLLGTDGPVSDAADANRAPPDRSGDLGISTGNIPIPLARPAALGQAAAASMDSYNAALSAGGDQATAEAMSIADRIKAALGFTVSPTISPTYIQPSTGGVQPTSGTGDKQSSITSSQSSSVRLTQHISSPNSRVAALRAQREANRSIRMAQARALGDLGPRTA